MEVALELIEDFKFKAKTSKDEFILDAKKISPVEYFATGLIGCTAYDIKYFAQKDGFEIKNYKVEAKIDRSSGVPYKFDLVHIIYSFDSNIEDIKAKRYVLASLESYCTTVNSIRDSVKITFSIINNGNVVASNESIISGTSSTIEAVIDDGFGAACCSSS
jgi:putative redox protein